MAFSNEYRKQDPLVIRPGELRHLVQIQAPVYAADARGMSVTPTQWTVSHQATAAIYTAGGKETSMASQIVSDVSRVVKIRWAPVVIKPNYRVAFGAQIFIVQYVENVLERNRVLLLYCIDPKGGAQ